MKMNWLKVTKKVLDEKQFQYVNLTTNEIVNEKQAKKCKSLLLDVQTANVILVVYDTVNNANKKKLLSMKLDKVANVCWKLGGLK